MRTQYQQEVELEQALWAWTKLSDEEYASLPREEQYTIELILYDMNLTNRYPSSCM